MLLLVLRAQQGSPLLLPHLQRAVQRSHSSVSSIARNSGAMDSSSSSSSSGQGVVASTSIRVSSRVSGSVSQ